MESMKSIECPPSELPIVDRGSRMENLHGFRGFRSGSSVKFVNQTLPPSTLRFARTTQQPKHSTPQTTATKDNCQLSHTKHPKTIHTTTTALQPPSFLIHVLFNSVDGTTNDHPHPDHNHQSSRHHCGAINQVFFIRNTHQRRIH